MSLILMGGFFAINSKGQGQINFLNGSTSLILIGINDPCNTIFVNAPSSVYGTRVQLFFSTNATAPIASSVANGFNTTGWTRVGNLGTAIGSNGRFSVGLVDIPNTTADVWLEALVWTGSQRQNILTYNTITEALSDSSILVGSSGEWRQVVGNPNATPPGTPVSTASYMNALGNIHMISGASCGPEPSTMTLMVVGASSLILIHKKKSSGTKKEVTDQ